MPEAFYNATEGGGGKKIHHFQRTIGANDVLDEVVTNGEPYLASYVATGIASIATANDHFMQVMAGASLNLYIRRVLVTQVALATTAGITRMQFRRLITAAGTGGTAITPAPLDPTDAASGATAMTLPTVKGTESTLVVDRTCQVIQTVGTGGAGLNTVLMDIDFDRMRTKGYRVAAGTTNGVIMKIITATAAATVSTEVWFSEANF